MPFLSDFTSRNVCVSMYVCTYYMCDIYACVHASTCICAHEGQKRMLGVLLYQVLSFSFQTGYLTEHRARLMASKTQGSRLLFPRQHWHYRHRHLPSFTRERGCELRSSWCSASTLTRAISSASPPGIFSP